MKEALHTLLPSSLVGLGTDGRILLATRGLRLFGTGLISVILAVYLAALGLELLAIGAVFTATLAGSAVLTVIVGLVGDRFGRRRLLMLTGGLMALAGAAFAVTDQLWILVLAGFIGLLSPGGADIGSALALEQAAMAQIVAPRKRAGVFAWANLVASAAVAVGALAAGTSSLLQHAGLELLAAYRLLLWAYVGLGLLLAVLAGRLSPRVEVPPAEHSSALRPWLPLHTSRGLILRFALLLGFNAFAAGFVIQSLVAYWFHRQFGADAATLGLIFFLTNLVGALSYPVAAQLAGRIGLINTMVFTHLPSNVLLMLVPLMPTLPLAAAVLVVRHALSQMDRPAREAYTMAVVAPDERTAAASLTSIAMDAGAALALATAGLLAQAVPPGALFLVAGILRCGYNGALWATFRRVTPAEETARRQYPGSSGTAC